MCGIAAVLKRLDLQLPLESVRRSAEEVAHRGPDGSGLIGLGAGLKTRDRSDARWTVGLGHRRLNIIDLSAAASQPMCYRDRYWMVYNGEVYNYVELRIELEQLGHRFQSHSDSEVILAAFAEWGTSCFSRLRGMWGLAIFDAIRNELTISRDRLGIKPLYLWRSGELVAVVSEIKQLLGLPGFSPRANGAAVAEYLRRGFEAPRASFFEDVRPLPAGTYLQFAVDRLQAGVPVGFWSPENVRVSIHDPREAAELFGAKLQECVRIHLRSDVPVGCALSGGLDSSAIAGIIDSQYVGDEGPLHTFTSTFPGDAIDERDYADAVVAQTRGIPHYVMPDPAEFLKDLDRYVWHHDEPVGDLSMYASYCLARLTRQAGVPVTLNGQGGDEILSGYWQSYFLYLRELGMQGRLTALGSHLLGALKRDGNSALLAQVPVMFRRYRAQSGTSTAIQLRNGFSPSVDILGYALALRGQDRRVGEIRDLFLPRLLKWDDRNSMAFSVEGRYPFLDHELIELCLSFSPDTLYYRGWTKWPLRLGLRHVLPDKVALRKSKFGFEVPQDRWLCGPLRPTIERWLESDRPAWNFAEPSDVRRLAEMTWRVSGEREEPGQALFRFFMFDRWLEAFGVQEVGGSSGDRRGRLGRGDFGRAQSVDETQEEAS